MLNWSKFLSTADKVVYEPVEKILRACGRSHQCLQIYQWGLLLGTPIWLSPKDFLGLWERNSQVGQTGSPRGFMAVTDSHLLVANTPAFLPSLGKTLMCILPEFPGASSSKPIAWSCILYYLPTILMFLSFLFWCFPGLPLKYWILWPLITMQYDSK